MWHTAEPTVTLLDGDSMKRAVQGLAVAMLLGGCGATDGQVEESSDADTGSTSDAPTTIASLDDGSGPQPGTDDVGSDGADPDGGSSDDDPGPDVPPVIENECDALLALVEALQDDPDDGDARIEAFFRHVAYGQHGFPMHDEGRLCFAYRDPVGVPLSVAGDFNAWVVGEHDLDYAAPQFDLRFAIIDVPDRAATGFYKFVRVRDDAEYFADPWARRFGWDEFGEFSRIDATPKASHYERWPQFELGAGELKPRDVVVYVPAAGRDEQTLSVLYMHDGQNLFAPDALFGGWRVGISMEFAIAGETAPKTLVVGIDNTEARFDEYTHVQDDLGGELMGGLADAYADFIVDGIKPFIDDRYPTAVTPEHTAIAGSSLGGLVSLYIAWRHPDVFGAAASMSGTVGWGSFGAGNPTVAELFGTTPPEGLRLYIDSGGGPGTGCPDGDSDNYCDNLALVERLRDLGWEDDEDLVYVWEPDAQHNEAEWAERFPKMILDWFPGNP